MATSTRTVTVAGTELAPQTRVQERPAETWRGRRNRYFVEEASKLTKFALFVGALVFFERRFYPGDVTAMLAIVRRREAV